jgi:uncharacterized protein YkwD
MKILSRKTQIILSSVYILICVIALGLFFYNQTISKTVTTLLGEQNATTSLAIETFSTKTVVPQPVEPISEKISSEEHIEDVIIEKKDSSSSKNGSGVDPLPTPVVTPTPTINSYTATGCDDGFASTMISLVNAHRAANNVPALSNDSALAGVGCAHSKWMIETGIFSHVGRNDSRFNERCERANTSCYGENIAFNSAATEQKIFDQFKASSGHNANMLNPNFTSIGVGYQDGYLTQVFR